MAYNHGKAERKWKLWIWITVFMQLFLAALDKIIFRDYNYNSVIYRCYIGGVQN